MQGFPYWPARVDLPAVIDRDIHRLRAEHFLFVRFYGWRANAAHLWEHADNVLSWDEGVAKGAPPTPSLFPA